MLNGKKIFNELNKYENAVAFIYAVFLLIIGLLIIGASFNNG